MPMDFDSLGKLLDRASLFGFREISEDETVAEYRAFLAEKAESLDPIEAHEIRTGFGWDKWSDEEFLDLVRRHPELAERNPMVISRLLSGGGKATR